MSRGIVAAGLALAVVTGCEGDSNPLAVPDSTFYDREVITYQGQRYTMVTRDEADGGGTFVRVEGSYHRCPEASAAACGPVIQRVLSRASMY